MQSKVFRRRIGIELEFKRLFFVKKIYHPFSRLIFMSSFLTNYIPKRCCIFKDGLFLLLLIVLLSMNLLISRDEPFSSSMVSAKVMKSPRKITPHAQNQNLDEFTNFIEPSCVNCIGNKKGL